MNEEVRRATEVEPAEPSRYFIQSETSIAESERHVLKHGDTFGVFDNHGDVSPELGGDQGLYYCDTRHVSRLQLWIGDKRPALLKSSVGKDNTLLTVDFTNPDFTTDRGKLVPHGCLHLFRSKTLWNGSIYESLRIKNYAGEAVDFTLSFLMEADYADLFEVRGLKREKRGQYLSETAGDSSLTKGYKGLDGIVRYTEAAASPTPDECAHSRIRYRISLNPGEHTELFLTISCRHDATEEDGADVSFQTSKSRRQREARNLKTASCTIATSNEQFNAWVNRSLEDLILLLTEVPGGYYPYAGIPWYNTFFGRDGILTAMMTLWINPNIARGVLTYLAQTQAAVTDPPRDAQPGKILHEARRSETANTREVPFGQYYGTVDATPLFVMLAAAYYRHTDDSEFIQSIWENIDRALEWIDRYGDLDGDGFIEYHAEAEDGLTQQGWKDSEDSVFHADGTLAAGPIALCEVQGYVYAAKKGAAELAECMNETERGRQLREEAKALKKQFNDIFWCEEIGTYALALDGDNEPCRVCSSNAGHALFTGIATKRRGARVADTLFRAGSFSGWGIRTIAADEVAFNPMSYHNGSIWPHDNALIGLGLSKYGEQTKIHRLLQAFFDASLSDELYRLPELYCGFMRRSAEGPTPYPVACAPQAWASVVVFALLRACLGLRVDATKNEVIFRQPALPPFLKQVKLKNLNVGDGQIDIALQRYEMSVGVEVTDRRGNISVITNQ